MTFLRMAVMPKLIYGKYILTTFQYGYLINNDYSNEELIPFIKDILNNPSITYNSIYTNMIIDKNYNGLYRNSLYHKIYLNQISSFWTEKETRFDLASYRFCFYF